MEILKTDQIHLEFEHTAYDDEILSGKTIRIKSIKPLVPIDQLDRLDFLLKKNRIVFAQYRIPATDLLQRKLLYKLGFYYVSTIAEMWLDTLQQRQFNWSSEFQIREFHLEKDLPEIKKIIKNNFGHGAFYEDPFLRNFATDRFYIILDKYALKRDWRFVLLENKQEKLLSWAIWHWEDKSKGTARAELLGTDRSIPRLGTYTANAMFNDMKQQGVDYVQLNITITNVSILTIYLRLGFHLLNPIEIYHIYLKGDY